VLVSHRAWSSVRDEGLTWGPLIDARKGGRVLSSSNVLTSLSTLRVCRCCSLDAMILYRM
jgi:hypothetical protein